MLLAGVGAQATSIEETRWGFGGTGVSGRLNLLSVRLFNNTPEIFEGVISLEKNGFKGRVGAKHIQPVFVSPYTERWVQFYTYVDDQSSTWEVKVGRGNRPGQIKELKRPRLKPPVRVFLSNDANSLGDNVNMKRFPDSLFPSTVSGLDGLYSVVLAHAPGWESPRRQAMRDWLYEGGVLHVFQNEFGEFPTFLRELYFINDVEDRQEFGAGLVVKHRKPIGKISERLLLNSGFKLPESVNAKNNGGGLLWQGLNAIMFTHLRKLVLPEHSWPLLFFVAALYVILICPVNYVFARIWKNHFKSIGFFVACMVVFSFIFALAGQRGFGESSSIHSLAYVKPLEGERVDVTSWNNVFSAKGRFVEITHDAGNRIYSTCETDEGVPGQIVNGPQGKFMLDMPIFSSAQFMLRTRLENVDLTSDLVEGAANMPEKVRVKVGRDFPEDILYGFGIVGDQSYPVEKRGEFLFLNTDRGQRTDQLLDNATRNQLSQIANNFRGIGRWGDDKAQEDIPLELKHRPLFFAMIEEILHKANLFNSGYRLPPHQGVEQLRLFLVVKGLEKLNAQSEEFSYPDSFMLLHQDLNFKTIE